MTQNESQVRPSRRTIAKGAAWTVPVVVAAQPALAANCSPAVFTLEIDIDKSCKKANASDYLLHFRVEAAGECPDPPNCNITINRIYESTGQGRELYPNVDPSLVPPTSSELQPDGGIKICKAPNMSNKIMVDATADCLGGTRQTYQVEMPQFTSGGVCAATDFCA